MWKLEHQYHSTFKYGGKSWWDWVLWTDPTEEAHEMGRGWTRFSCLWDALQGFIKCYCGKHEASYWRYDNGPSQKTCIRCAKNL
jgi:hypothetical protein